MPEAGTCCGVCKKESVVCAWCVQCVVCACECSVSPVVLRDGRLFVRPRLSHARPSHARLARHVQVCYGCPPAQAAAAAPGSGEAHHAPPPREFGSMKQKIQFMADEGMCREACMCARRITCVRGSHAALCRAGWRQVEPGSGGARV